MSINRFHIKGSRARISLAAAVVAEVAAEAAVEAVEAAEVAQEVEMANQALTQ